MAHQPLRTSFTHDTSFAALGFSRDKGIIKVCTGTFILPYITHREKEVSYAFVAVFLPSPCSTWLKPARISVLSLSQPTPITLHFPPITTSPKLASPLQHHHPQQLYHPLRLRLALLLPPLESSCPRAASLPKKLEKISSPKN
jgi:hypothetical protein